jgi:hypothetical protein
MFRASPDPRAQIASHGPLREIKAAHPGLDWLSLRTLSSKIDRRSHNA